MITMQKMALILILVLLSSINFYAQKNTVFTVKANEMKATIPPTMWGIFFRRH